MTSEGDVRATRRRPRRAFVVAAIAYVALAVGVGGPLVWPIVAPNHMLVIGHSGDVANWPRNTLDSVISASKSGADGLEFDVNRSAEGTWWLFHDGNLAETTTGEGSSRSAPTRSSAPSGSMPAWAFDWPRAPRPRAWLA